VLTGIWLLTVLVALGALNELGGFEVAHV
jgi:hypothetical protein